LLSLAPEEHVVEVQDLQDYSQAKYLVLATRNGVIKKSRLSDYDSSRSTGLVAISLRDEDDVVSAQLVNDEDDLLLVSKMGYSVRCHADDATLRPMGRTAGGVIGIRFKSEDDYLLKMEVATADSFVVTVTEGGWAKRTSIEEWNAKGRGTQGVRAMRLVEKRGGLAGALICAADDEIFAIASNGVVIRTRVDEIRAAGRDTMGVGFMKVGDDEQVVAVARSSAASMAALDSVEVSTDVEEGTVIEVEEVTEQDAKAGEEA
jgi:DNA gyrase subunit A